jgi:hypothetical protein
MGFFSWRTQDTDRSIANNWSIRDTFKVDMVDDKGNVWTESNYEGYGVFGGKDYYELLAEMNGITDNGDGRLRNRGIDLAFSKNNSGARSEGVLYPNLVEDARGWTFDPLGPETCDDQGYFYDADEDEDEEEELED